MSKPRENKEWKRIAADVVARGRIDDAPCCRCGGPVDYGAPSRSRESPSADHLNPLATGGALLTDAVAVAHYGCNSSHGAKLGNAMRAGRARQQKVRRPPAGSAELHVVAPEERTIAQSYDGGPLVAHSGRLPTQFAECSWLKGIIDIPENATWPRVMSAPHRDAIGTFGWAAIKRIEARREADILTPKKHKKLRWWQKLVVLRLYEYNADFELCWKTAVLSTSRQVGKSVLMREIALDRMTMHEHFGEPQLVLHVAKDLTIANEIQRPSRQWADMLGWPWHAVGNNGNWAVEYEGVLGRWLIRAQKAVYGYASSVAMIDEGWAIDPLVISEGIEPTMAEREQPLLLLISTAHSRATKLMPQWRNKAMENMATGDILIIEWSAPPEAEFTPTEPVFMRMASPHWDEHRRAFVESKINTEGAAEQWLNIWPDTQGQVETLVRRETWDSLYVPGLEIPRGASVGRTAVVYPDLDQGYWHIMEAAIDAEENVCLRVIPTTGTRKEALEALAVLAKKGGVELVIPRVIRGRIPKIPGVRSVILAAETDLSAAATTVRPMLTSGRVKHDGSALLAEQMVSAVIETYGETIRISAKHSGVPVEAAKAATLAVWWSSRVDRVKAVVV